MVGVYALGSRVEVGGQDFLRVEVGMLGAGGAAERTVELPFAPSEAALLQSTGANILVTVHSDQGEEVFRTRYNPWDFRSSVAELEPHCEKGRLGRVR